MTGTDLLNLALPLMFATDSTEYQAAAIPVINLLLADCFESNNSIRIFNGDAELTEIPSIAALSEELPYEDAINRKVLPFGLAGYLYAEDDATISTLRMNKYEYEKANNYKCAYEEIEDLTEDDL
jgi:hypothetical protein